MGTYLWVPNREPAAWNILVAGLRMMCASSSTILAQRRHMQNCSSSEMQPRLPGWLMGPVLASNTACRVAKGGS